MLVENFTAAENLVLGDEPTSMLSLGWLGPGRLNRSFQELAQRFGLPLDPETFTGELGVGQRQRLEILKALRRDSPILALDEPTAVLAPQEIDDLLRTILDLKEAGRTIILVTHKLREVLDVADEVTILRRGRMVGTFSREELDQERLARLMMGVAEDQTVAMVTGPKCPAPMDTAPRLAIHGLSVSVPLPGGGTYPALRGVTMEVAPGEILGVAGIEGNGQVQLSAILGGVMAAEDGEIFLDGKPIHRQSTAARRRSGLGIVPEDRHRQGLVLPLSVRDNLRLGRHRFRQKVAVQDLLEQFDIRPRNPELPVGSLSGGNQQKLLIAREATLPGLKALVVSQPTRGVDLGAIALIHQALLVLRAQGVAILLISSELDEILALSDRVAVIRDGRVVWTGDNNDEVDAHRIGFHMLDPGVAAYEAQLVAAELTP
jgi:simple sugar transport system ATP-binding protein